MKRALAGAEIFDGERLHKNSALLLDDGCIAGFVTLDNIPKDYVYEEVPGGTILPGFVDLQVNGGGGVMFNEETNVDGLKTIAEAHAATGTGAFLPTLITDTPERTFAAADAVVAAMKQRVPGVIGLHLEGPHLSVSRKGAHDPDLIRPMSDADEAFLIRSADRIPNLMVTIAPESVTVAQIANLAKAGIIVSLGHTDCTLTEATSAFDAGACCVTHLFNAMSQMGNREPGLVGAALDSPSVFAGMIVDNVHVHQASMRVALEAKREPKRIFLVTDAMATAGSKISEFTLNGRRILRTAGKLTLGDGTLAGADLEMSRAVSILISQMGIAKETVLAMATSLPAQILPKAGAAGRLVKGAPSNAIWLDSTFNYRAL